MPLWSELRRRNVFKVGVAYAIVAWLLAQVAALLAPALTLPDWVSRFVVFLLLLGFPVALILAWAYELTPEGIKRTKRAPLAESLRQMTGQKLNYVVTGLLAVAVVFMAVDNYLLDERSAPGQDASELTVSDGPETIADSTKSGILRNSVAVLPFDNLSPNPDDSYFAAQIHEEILNQLAKVEGLSVISRTSVMRYAENRPPIPQIAEELGVEAVLEGSVKYAGTRILVTVQLIDGALDRHVWSETYPGDLSNIETIFAQQADIAINVARALRAELTDDEIGRLAYVQTGSGAAYALYLRVVERTGSFAAGIEYLDEAIRLDPDFAEAYGYRAYLYAVSLITEDLSTAENPLSYADIEAHARADAEHALALDPNAGSAYRALGNLHSFAFRWRESEAAFRRAVEVSPSDATNLANLAMFSSFIGAREQALTAAQRFAELNPGTAAGHVIRGRVYTYLKEPDNAVASLEEALQIAPEVADFRFRLARAQIQRGDFAAAEQSLRLGEQLLDEGPESGRALAERAYSYGRIGLAEDARRLFGEFEAWAESASAGAGQWALAYLAVGENDRALDWLTRVVEKAEAQEGDQGYFATNTIRGNVLNDPVLERPEFAAARERLRIE